MPAPTGNRLRWFHACWVSRVPPRYRAGDELHRDVDGASWRRGGAHSDAAATRRLAGGERSRRGLLTTAQLDLARELREAIHAAATAAALQHALPASAVDVINDRSVQGRAAAILTPEGGRRWRLSSASCVEDALSVIAADAISIIAGERDGRLALCASPTCQAAFFDTSQSRTRKWCDMNTCGNRQKKARFNARKREHPGSAE